MATSSAMSTSNQYIKYKITITQNSQSITNNTSNVTVSVKFYRTNTGYTTYGTGKVYCKINGTTYNASVTSSQKITSSGIVLFTKTLNISHATDGTKRLTCSAWIDHSQVTSSEQSYSQTLTTIPRKSTLTASNGTLGKSQTLTVTKQASSFTHTITYKCGNASGTICTKSSSTSVSFTPPISLVKQTSSRTSVSVTLTITTYNGSTSLGSNTKTISCTIPAKTTISASNGELGTPLIFSVTKKNDSYKHTVTYKCGSASGTICSKSVSSSECWSGDNGNTEALSSQNTSGKSVSVTFTTTTYYDTTVIGTATLTLTMDIPSSVVPTIKSCNVSDATGFKDVFGGYIQGHSKLYIYVEASGAYGSNPTLISVVANGKTYSAKNTTQIAATTGVITASNSTSIKVTVTDTRGRTATKTVTVSGILAYSPPLISLLKVKRCEADGTENIQGEYCQVTYTAGVSPLNNKNGGNYTLEYKKTSETTYTTYNLNLIHGAAISVTQGTYIFAADSASSYDVRLIVEDTLGVLTGKPTVLSTAEVIQHLRSDGHGMGIGKIGEVENGLDVGYVIKPNKGFINIPLEANTDFNDIKTPNTYVSYNAVASTYKNCPCTTGTFTLEVTSGGNEGQVKQVVTYTSHTDFKIWVRHFHSAKWGEWHKTYSASGNILWSGGYYMTETHSITLSEAISKQPNGIVLVFSYYSDGTIQDYNFNSFFISKHLVVLQAGGGHSFSMFAGNFSTAATKYLYINDTTIKGHADNGKGGTGSTGIVYSNNKYVLRYVIGV